MELRSKNLNLKTIEHNITIFLNIKEYEKIIIHNDHQIEIDYRYFQMIRRSFDRWIWSYNSSRQATYDIIQLTYESLKFYQQYITSNIDQIIDSLNNLFLNFQITYPNFRQLSDLIESFQVYYKSQKQSDPDQNPDDVSWSGTSSNLLWYYYLCIDKNKPKFSYEHD
jgi:hypothetical protein